MSFVEPGSFVLFGDDVEQHFVVSYVAVFADIFELQLRDLCRRNTAERALILSVFKLSDLPLESGDLIADAQDVRVFFRLVLTTSRQLDLARGAARKISAAENFR